MRRLARRGLAAPTPGAGRSDPDRAGFRAALAEAGYTAPCDDDTLLQAFRLRHRQSASGPLDATDMALALALADT